MFLWSDSEDAASQMANDVDTVPVIGLATVPGAEEIIKVKADDDKVHGVQDPIEGFPDGTRNFDNEQGIIEDFFSSYSTLEDPVLVSDEWFIVAPSQAGARVIDGTHVIVQYVNHPER